jgi:hypothetical protein
MRHEERKRELALKAAVSYAENQAVGWGADGRWYDFTDFHDPQTAILEADVLAAHRQLIHLSMAPVVDLAWTSAWAAAWDEARRAQAALDAHASTRAQGRVDVHSETKEKA